jgi:hypothetical protein
MKLLDRVKNILTSPNTEWDVINGEEPNTSGIITGYVLPLAGAAAVAAFIGYGLIGFNFFGFKVSGTNWGVYHALNVLVMAVCSVFIGAFVIDALAPSFGSEKNMGRSVQLVAYSYTPGWIGGLLAIIPSLALIGTIAALYGLYLLYVGLPKLKKTPADKQMGYFIVSLVVLIVIYFVIGLIMSKVVMSSMGLSNVGNLNLNF